MVQKRSGGPCMIHLTSDTLAPLVSHKSRRNEIPQAWICHPRQALKPLAVQVCLQRYLEYGGKSSMNGFSRGGSYGCVAPLE